MEQSGRSGLGLGLAAGLPVGDDDEDDVGSGGAESGAVVDADGVGVVRASAG